MAAACVHESPTSDFFWIHRDSNQYATVFGRRGGKVTHRRTAILHGGFKPVNGEQKDNTADGNPAPAILYTNGAGANYQNCVVRNNKLVAAANIGQKWANNGGLVSNAVRLIRVDVSNFFAGSGPLPVEIERIFGKSAPDDPVDQVFHYGWPAVATNANGDIVVGSVRTRETIFPEQRASVLFAGDSALRPSVSIRRGLDMAVDGHYHMAGAAADPVTNAVYLAQEYPVSGNRRVHITKMLGTNRPDVIPLSLTAPSTLARGATYSASLTVMNQGDAAMPAFKARLHLSTDDTISAFDASLASFSIRSVAPGETAVVPVSIAIPRTTAAGPYYIGARLDIETSALEHSETNNANPFLRAGRGNIAATVQ
ncbi:MAG TPA: CARDB domain-containing protein [Vicinamibacterales bacterium]|jgi:hypothetical protein|nr:CARDB domain-containing protein [Vicinamibacterales bacterium]